MAGDRPSKIGKYDVVDVIGRGGMGIVYKAKDPQLGRLVAIKMMTAGFDDNPEHLRRFFREAQSTASLQHPNIVTVYALGDYAGHPYLVMEFLEGHSLDVMIAAQRPLALFEKLNIMVAVCQGLAYAHQRKIIHRDVKPANIMVLPDAAIKIVDFGIAHIGGKNETRTGQVIGSISYMSPEQINSKPIDCRTDIFSAAVVLYQLLTYSLPFEGDTTAATLLKIVHEAPPPLHKFLPIFPPELESIILRALSKDREERYPSAAEFAVDLGRIRDQVRQEILGRHLEQAAALLERNELYKAKEEVLEVLKLDRHHTRASHLLREIQQRIQRQQACEQVRQLTTEAETAYQHGEFEKALGHLDRALAMADDKAQLEHLREEVQGAWERAQKFAWMFDQAQSAYQQGDLDSAIEAIDQALKQVPDHSKAKALHAAIEQDWQQRARQRQLDEYVRQARDEITSRRFTAALEILKSAQDLDPDAPQVRALVESAMAGQQQERKRRELESIDRDIEDALGRDDYIAARDKAIEGLQSFPDEPRLLKFLELAEKQLRSAERKRYIDEQLTSARRLLEQGRNEELVALLEQALRRVGSDPMLESLLVVVREHREREQLERRKQEYLQTAKDEMRRKEYGAAVRTLEGARAELSDVAEIDDLLQFARGEAAEEERRQKLSRTGEAVRKLVGSKQYEEAIKLIEATLSEIPDDELRIVLAETRNAAADYREKRDTVLSSAEKLLANRKPNEALKLLESESSLLSAEIDWQRLMALARRDAEHLEEIQQAVAEARRLSGDGQFDSARRRLEDCGNKYGKTPELDREFHHLEQQRALANCKQIEKVMDEARTLIAGDQWATALDRLASVSQLLAEAPANLRAAHKALAGEASAHIAQQAKSEIEQHLAAGRITRARQALERTLTNIIFPVDGLSELEGRLQQEVERRNQAQKALEQARALLKASNWSGATELLTRAHAEAVHAPELRSEVIEEFFHAAELALESSSRSSEQVLEQLARLEPNREIPAGLLAELANRKREEAIVACLAESRRLELKGNFQAALGELSRGLATYPEDARLTDSSRLLQERIHQAEEKARQAKIRRDQEAAVLDILRRAEAETAPHSKVAILEEGLAKYPHDSKLDEAMKAAAKLEERLALIVNEARAREGEKQYDEALHQWEALRVAYSRYPDLEENLKRVKTLRDEARELALRDSIAKLQGAITAGDFREASHLLAASDQQFPSNPELAAFHDKVQVALKLRSKAEKALTDARRYFAKARWEAGSKAIMRTLELAKEDPVIWKQATEELLAALNLSRDKHPQLGQRILRQLSELKPHLPLPAGLEKMMAETKLDTVPAHSASQPTRIFPTGNSTDRSGRSWIEKVRSAMASLSGAPEHEAETNPPLRADSDTPSPGQTRELSGQVPAQESQQRRVIEFPTVLDLRGRTAKAAGSDVAVSGSASISDAVPTELIASPQKGEAQPETAAQVANAPAEARVLYPSAPSGELTTLDGSHTMRWPGNTLAILDKQMATFVGPVARILVRRAAAKAANLEELYAILLDRLEKPAEREALLRGKPAVAESLLTAAGSPEQEAASVSRLTVVGSAAREINHEALERATRVLARYVGPISGVLVKRAAPRADSVRALYLLLAQHVNDTDRDRFLQDSGFFES